MKEKENTVNCRSYHYPKAEEVEFSEVLGGGYVNHDPYQWFEDRDNVNLRKWVAEENAFTDAFFDRDRLEERAEKLKAEAAAFQYGIPHFAHGKIYVTRTDPDGYSVPVILDEDWNLIAEIGTELTDQLDLFAARPCPTDEDLVWISCMPFGAHIFSVLIYALSEKKVLFRADDILDQDWAPDGSLWYAQQIPHTEEGYMENPVWRRPADGGAPVKIYDSPRGRVGVSVRAEEDNSCIIGSAFTFGTNELLRAWPDGRVISITGDLRSKNDYCGQKDGVAYVLTDDGAPMGKITAGGKTIVTECGRMIMEALVLKDALLVIYMEDVCSRMELFSFEGEKIGGVELPDRFGSVTCRSGLGYDKEKGLVTFLFQSFTLSPALCGFWEENHRVEKLFSPYEEEASDDVTVEQIFVTSRDGVKIPAFVVRRKDAEKNRSNPVLMYGYGGYNVAVDPAYTNRICGITPWKWAKDGGIFVSCNLRGGCEYGSAWHEAAMFDRKMNAFNDFIDIAEHMIGEGWTKAGKIGICGASNGGLLMSALLTMRPDLWGAVIDSVPHTDMLRFVNDPAGPRYILEYGNPREEKMCEYILKYSPYHNIRPVAYPPVYVQTGERDNNVPPYHGKKFAARLQQVGKGGPVLLRVLAEGAHNRGHGDVMYRTMAEMQLFLEKYIK